MECVCISFRSEGPFHTAGEESMADFFGNFFTQLVLWLTVAILLGAIAVYVIGVFRTESVQREPVASDLMSKFREMHSRGELSDEEFRTIRTTLAVQIQDELNDTEETG